MILIVASSITLGVGGSQGVQERLSGLHGIAWLCKMNKHFCAHSCNV